MAGGVGAPVNGPRVWPFLTFLGALPGVCVVAFVVVFALFIRDMALSGQTCLLDTRDWPPGFAVVELCLNRTRAAPRRLWWEVPALVIAGGLGGAALAGKRMASTAR